MLLFLQGAAKVVLFRRLAGRDIEALLAVPPLLCLRLSASPWLWYHDGYSCFANRSVRVLGLPMCLLLCIPPLTGDGKK